MVSIGKIVVKREIKRHLIPPAYEPMVRGPSLAVEQVPTIVHQAPPSLMAAGGSSIHFKQVVQGLTQNVTISENVARVKTPGVTGISYTQTSFTFTSYTITGVAVTKSLSDTITITEPLAVQRAKTRVIADSDLTEASETLDIVRTKTRALAETETVSDAVVKSPETRAAKTLAESITISEGVTTVKESKRSRTETISESGDVAITLPGFRALLTEDVTISDSVIREITYAAGHNARELIETVTVSEGVTATTAKKRAFTESVPVSENLVRVVTIAITSFMDDSFTSISYTIFTEARIERALVETEEESHTVRIILTKARGITENVTIIG
jgi:hypothetical protein